MTRTTSGHGSGTTGSGGMAPPPSDFDFASADEGPMRGELKRQIESLERQLAKYIVENCPYEPLPAVERRGPSVLTTEQLEYVRDELVAVMRELHERVVSRVSASFADPQPDPPGLLERVRLRLRLRLRAQPRR